MCDSNNLVSHDLSDCKKVQERVRIFLIFNIFLLLCRDIKCAGKEVLACFTTKLLCYKLAFGHQFK